MEELRKLEQLHTTLTFMQSHNFVPSSTLDSNRFIANLILLLLQPCGELNLDMKFRLLSEYLPKISVSFLEEASQWVRFETDERDYQEVNDPSGKKDCLPLQINHEEVAMVGLEAMERANSTLEDFCRSYFMFHGVDVGSPFMIFKYFPVLAFTESYIYQLDGLNEKILSIPTEGDTSLAKQFEKMNYQCWAGTFANMLEKDPFRPLLNVLELQGLLTDRIREEFRSGEEYWALERKLCRALTHKMEISIKDVMRAIHLKSFDYRVLNLLLYQLRGQESAFIHYKTLSKCIHRLYVFTMIYLALYILFLVNDLHMEFLSVSEFLVEISDDLFKWTVSVDDVLENNFNILRMFVKIYGPSTAPAMLAKYITDAEERYDNLLKTLDPQLSSKYQRRCEEATKEGGKVSGHPLGTWSIPPVIINEDLYRSNYWRHTADSHSFMSLTEKEPCELQSQTPAQPQPNPHRVAKKRSRQDNHSPFRGVRKRRWGRYVSEIRLPGQKTRIWLGSFGSPEMAARAYDSAAFFLKGDSAILNFPELVGSLPRPESCSRRDIQSAAAKAALEESVGRVKDEEGPESFGWWDDVGMAAFEEVKASPLRFDSMEGELLSFMEDDHHFFTSCFEL
ncbi:hypothetical protein CXB51_026317 [Gossypium anomalum]|uniref:AP2/ERF domain-containing protein n=1 Tax=Gossypium anomalum TaxID=47600 RepID=A0A8J5Y473_9ROSI|nr:hypothetical protein CXB51_026317 [Gossypium anomalum]